MIKSLNIQASVLALPPILTQRICIVRTTSLNEWTNVLCVVFFSHTLRLIFAIFTVEQLLCVGVDWRHIHSSENEQLLQSPHAAKTDIGTESKQCISADGRNSNSANSTSSNYSINKSNIHEHNLVPVRGTQWKSIKIVITSALLNIFIRHFGTPLRIAYRTRIAL